MIKNRERYHRAFALPTVLITSAVMMIILLVALTSVSSISVSLDGQYYNKLAREAGESGLTMAKACIAEIGEPTWSNSSPLHPNTDCGGGPACVGGDQCYVLSDGNTKTSFTVGVPTLTSDGAYLISAKATTQLLRTSNGEVWKTYSDTVSTKIKIGWKQISSNYYHACGITLDGSAYCRGYNYYGMLGNGTTTTAYSQVAVSPGEMPGKATFKSITTGYQHTCGISASDSKAYCWGDNAYGQLGNGTTTDSSTPVAVVQGGMPSNAKLKAIVAGYRHTCAITTGGKAYCWGYNYYGQLGDNSTTQSTSPVAVNTTLSFKVLGLGYMHSCGITTLNKAYCWGYNVYSQLGNGSTTQANSPVAVSAGAIPSSQASLTNITAGYYHTCTVDDSGSAYCWGYNYYGQLGDNSTTTRSVPVLVSNGAMPSSTTMISLAASRYHTCAVASNHKAYCWGQNTYGQLGDGTTTGAQTPVAVESLGVLNGKQVESITEGLGYYSCALDVNHKAYCWGQNTYGQLGTGSTGNSSVPVGARSVTDMGVVY